ncbi:MAG: RDD family protein [Acidobacteria bacterium]|nr:MAG: RDD family protein [Acidobacteriota bacterium]
MDIMSSDQPDSGSPLGSFADKLTIETPEQTALEFAVAGIGSRFLALALDTLIQMLVGFVALFGGIFVISLISAAMPKAGMWGAAILILFFFLLYFGYFALFEIIWNGQTPGKRKAGIRVIKDSGRPLTPAESIGRNLMRIVDWLPAFYAVGMVSAILTKENKRLGDLVAGSLVVRESSFSTLKPAWQTAEMPAAPGFSPVGADRLSPEECALIDSYLNRRLDLEPSVRFRMADEILGRLKSKLTLPAEGMLSSDRILEALAYERRASGRYS